MVFNMDLCRICLSSSAIKNIYQLQSAKKCDNKSYLEIFKFCLDIQIVENSKITTKLCVKCFKRILSFYKFKSLALQNDAYLKSIDPAAYIKLEALAPENEEDSDFSDNNNIDVKEEPDIKIESEILECQQSDDELLSVLKTLKDEKENNTGECKENAPVKKRGRPSKVKNGQKKEKEICEECGKSVWSLKEHMVKHVPLNERAKIQCKVCAKVFSTYGARYRHNKIKHLGIKQHCNICNKDVVHLKSHHLIAHNTEALPFGCVVCQRRFIRRSALDNHMLIHSKDLPFECDVCQKKFRLKNTMQLHKRQVHDKERTHLCQFCSKSFFKKYHLHLHLRSHTKEKPHKCPECGKFFSTTSVLNNHRQTHGEARFKCDFCESSFTNRNYLQVHMLSHTKEKKHPCKYCGVRFSRSDHRKRHEFTAHEKHLLSAP